MEAQTRTQTIPNIIYHLYAKNLKNTMRRGRDIQYTNLALTLIQEIKFNFLITRVLISVQNSQMTGNVKKKNVLNIDPTKCSYIYMYNICNIIFDVMVL